MLRIIGAECPESIAPARAEAVPACECCPPACAKALVGQIFARAWERDGMPAPGYQPSLPVRPMLLITAGLALSSTISRKISGLA